jgi:hypothetical protein
MMLMLRQLCVLASLAIPSLAAADTTTHSLAILDLRFSEMPPALADQIRERLRQGLAEQGYAVIEDSTVGQKLKELGAPPGCHVGPCLARVGKLLRVERVVVGGIAGQGSSYDLTVTLLESGGGGVLAQVNRRCDVCNFKEVEDFIGRATLELHKQALVFLSTRATLAVTSNPTEAEILLDGQSAGRSPVTQVISPGRHTVEVVAGARSVKQEVLLEPGRTRILRVDLAEARGLSPVHPVAGSTRSGGVRVPTWLKWASLGTGILLGGVGGGVWGLDGRETCDGRYVQDTRSWGVALVSVGAVLAVSSAVFYFLEESPAPAAAGPKEAGRNKLANFGCRGARLARREEGAYSSVCNRRATQPEGMDRQPEWQGYSGQPPKPAGGA